MQVCAVTTITFFCELLTEFPGSSFEGQICLLICK